MSRLLFVALIFLFAVTGCAPNNAASTVPMPTMASLPSAYTLDEAQQVAQNFLEAWRTSDFQAMYDLTAFASQDATPYADFQSLYQESQDEMTLSSLSYQINTVLRERDDMAVFNYDMTFQTRLVGQFSDHSRSLHLVVDSRAQNWRVAWSPGDIFADMANGGQLRLDLIVPNRANIYDRNGIILADQNGRVVDVSVVRERIPQYQPCLTALATALNKQSADLQAKLEARPANWLMDMGTIDPPTYTQMHTQLEQNCGAQFDDHYVRHYENPTLAPQIIGDVGYPDDSELPALEALGFNAEAIVGRSGIESSWDETLRGRPGGRLSIVGSDGSRLRVVAERTSQPSESVWLTIDSDLQTRVQQIVNNAYTQAKDSWGVHSQGAAVIVMDVQTGQILAMVSYPGFDENAFTPFPSMGRQAADTIINQVENDPRHPQLNRATLGLYPTGSVMKIISTAAVADSGVYALDQRYTCIGYWDRDIVRSDWWAPGHGTIDLQQALTESCDPYFYEAGYQMNQRDPMILPTYARQMGLGELTGLRDLPETAGLIPDPDWLRTTLGLTWTFSDAVNTVIGQGYVQATPLQVTRMVAAVANGGTLYRPQLVMQAGILGESPTYTATPDAMSNINIKPEVLALVQQGMCGVTTANLGTATFIFRDSPLQASGVCGKTGTAQNPSPSADPYAWFAAYAPATDPQIAVVAMVEESGEGSEIAAPIVRAVMEYYFKLNQ